MPVTAAYLFPTFPFRHREFTHDRLEGYAGLISRLAARAGAVVPITPRTFAHPDPAAPASDAVAALDATLQAQYACYIENVAMAEWLEARYPRAAYVAGYSMGMFSAACYAGALSFEDGLRLMREVCVNAHRLAPPGRFAIGAVIGMTPDRVPALLAEEPGVEITDVYSAHIVLMTGPEEDVARVLAAARAAGAPDTRLTPFSAPFHSSRLAPVEALTAEALEAIPVAAPRVPMISPVTLEAMSSTEQIRRELVRNVSHGMNWYGTIRALITLNVSLLLESGTSTHLTNLVREDVPDPCETQDFRDFEQRADTRR